MSPWTEQYAILPNSRIVLLAPDGEHFRLLSLTDVGHVSAELAKAGYTIAGAVAPVSGEYHGVAEPGCGSIVDTVIAAFRAKEIGEPESAEIAWLDALHRLDDPRS
jgi:hypothetical protein